MKVKYIFCILYRDEILIPILLTVVETEHINHGKISSADSRKYN